MLVITPLFLQSRVAGAASLLKAASGSTDETFLSGYSKFRTSESMGGFTFLELGRVDVEKLGDSTSGAIF